MKIFILTLLFLFLLNNLNSFVLSRAPICKTSENVYQGEARGKYESEKVEWWYLQQLRDDGAIYTDSLLSKKKIIGESYDFSTKKRNDKNESILNPISLTFKQSFEKEFHSISYNNEPRKKKLGESRADPGNGAHSKGFFIWNDEGGIHVIHSYPKSPIIDDQEQFFEFFTGKADFSQHSFCITLNKDQLDIIPKLIIYGDFIINSINNVNIRHLTDSISNIKSFDSINKSFAGINKNPITMDDLLDGKKVADLDDQKKTFSNFDTEVFEKLLFVKSGTSSHWSKKVELKKWQRIASQISNQDFTSDITKDMVHYNKVMDLNNDDDFLYFVQTSHETLYKKREEYGLNRRGFTIIWEFIADYYIKSKALTNKLYVNTLHALNSDKENRVPYPANVQLVSRTDAPRTLNSYTTDGREHSKIAYLTQGDFKVFCVGDLNFQGKQESRGGSSLCSQSLGYLAEFYERRVGILGKPPPPPSATSPYSKFGSEVIVHSSSGLSLDFTKIVDMVKTIASSDMKQTMEIFLIDNKVEKNFNPRLYINSNIKRVLVDYKVDGKIDFGIETKEALYGELNDIYIPTILKETTPPGTTNKFNFETVEDLLMFIYPSIKNDIILCDLNQPQCEYDYFKYKVADKIKAKFIFMDFKKKNLERDKRMELIYKKAEKKELDFNFLNGAGYEERNEKLELVNHIGLVKKYFQIDKEIRFVETVFSEDQKSQMLGQGRDDNGDDDDDDDDDGVAAKCVDAPFSDAIYYDKSCFNYLIYCLNEHATQNIIQFNSKQIKDADFNDEISKVTKFLKITPTSCKPNIKNQDTSINKNAQKLPTKQ